MPTATPASQEVELSVCQSLDSPAAHNMSGEETEAQRSGTIWIPAEDNVLSASPTAVHP